MNHRFIAQTMCELTHEELWLPRREWALQKREGGELTIRVGTGMATKVVHSRLGKGPLTLTYGIKMIQSKMDPQQLCRWLTAREIRERGYFGGDVTLLNALAHTVVHEFAHVVQVFMGVREPGGSHTPEFYQILDKAHRKGHADTIRARLHQACLARGMDLTTIVAAERPKTIGPGLGVSDVAIGQTAYFHGEHAIHNPLEIIKKRRTKLVVKTAGGKSLLAPAAMVYKSP